MDILFKTIPYIVIVLNVFFYLISGDFTSNCGIKPNLTIFVDGKNLTYNGTEVQIGVQASVEIMCISSEPLELDFKGEMAHRFEDIEITRDRGSHNKSCFVATLKFNATESATGNYTCGTIATRKLNSLLTSVFIYANNRTDDKAVGHLLNAEQCITTGGKIPDNFQMIIPCVVTNPAFKPKLYRSYYDGCKNINETFDSTAEQNFTYDPKIGFIIDTRNTMDCWTNFVCVLGNQNLRVQTIKPAEFRATPPEATRIYQQTNEENSQVMNYNEYAKITFICESRKNITFTYPTSLSIPKIKYYPKEPKKYYMYKSKLQFVGDFQSAGTNSTVSCVTTENDEMYWTWTIVYKGHEDKTGLFYDEITRSFRCYSATANHTIPTLKIIQCSSILDCTIAKRFIQNNMTANFPYKVSADGYLCRNQPATIYSGCKEFPIELGDKFGMAHCQTGDHHYYNIYYTNLHEKTVTVIGGNEKDILFSKIERIVFVNETVSLSCKSSALRFAKGIQIVAAICDCNEKSYIDYFEKCQHCLIYDYDFPKNASFNSSENVEHNVITFNASMRIWTNRIVKLWCRSPILTSKEWISVDDELTVTEGEYPLIEDFQDEMVKLNENDEDKTLKCSATGDPLPKLSWEKDGDIQQANASWTSENNSKAFSTLILPKVLTYMDRKYYCIATNAKGSARKMYIVVIKQWLPEYALPVIIVGTVAIILLLLLLILIRALRRQKRTIEKLTEAEIMEFENGNETMMQHASELNEIAQYLPYNQDFEIPEKKLELIDEDLLGTGAFGVVLKGFVEKDGEKYAVAIKTIKSINNIAQLKKLLAEIKIMMYIGRHPNIIYLVGAQTRKIREGKVCVIVEYCTFGSLQTFLRENRSDFVNQVVHDKIDEWIVPRTRSMKQNRNAFTKLPECPIVYQSKRFSQQLLAIRTLDLVNWCFQLANGMDYLRMKKVIHGDLATRNLLLTEDWTLKITDFGLSRHMYEYADYIRKQKEEPLPWRWLSIEAIRDSKFSTMSDVWAFGVTAWEIFSLAEVPYPGFSWGEEFVRALSKGYRLSKPQYATTDLYNKMLDCWNQELTDRPNFKDLKDFFQQILESYPHSTERLLESFLGPEPFNFECKSVQTTEDMQDDNL